MNKLVRIASIAAVLGAVAAPAFATNPVFNPKGTFVDKWGTSFSFAPCGSDLCGTLDTLKGNAATAQNLAYVGKQVMEAKPDGPNTWKGSISAGGMSAQATVTQTSGDIIDIQGCRAVFLCQTIRYTRQ